MVDENDSLSDAYQPMSQIDALNYFNNEQVIDDDVDLQDMLDYLLDEFPKDMCKLEDDVPNVLDVTANVYEALNHSTIQLFSEHYDVPFLVKGE